MRLIDETRQGSTPRRARSVTKPHTRKHTMKYTLRCIAPDGAFVREGEFPSVDAAWSRANDMGSRWFFYPFQVVTGSTHPDRCKIVSAPDGYAFLEGVTFKSARQWVADNYRTIFDA